MRLLTLLILVIPLNAYAFLTDGNIHAPPTGGSYLYSPPGGWLPGDVSFLDVGESYIEPIFGSTVIRLTDTYPASGCSENYARNGFWNADGTVVWSTADNCTSQFLNTSGAVLRTGVPGGVDGSFDPVDPDVWYYFSGAQLRQYLVSTGGNSLVKTFASTLGSTGGSVDWIDRTGRYFLLNIGSNLRIWDKQTDTLYTGSIPYSGGSGWAGISPDGNYVITTDDYTSYQINHGTTTLSTSGTIFWTLCGDHGDIISASNGNTYVVTANCNDAPEVYRVDVTIAQTAGNTAKQKSDNLKLIDEGWAASGAGHYSCVSKGTDIDWCFMSTESGNTAGATDPSSWTWAYKDEIIAMNVLTGEVRRYAHHRSRDMDENNAYWRQPRVQASWSGNSVLWSSNYGRSGATDYSDVYMITLDAEEDVTAPTAPSTLTATTISSSQINLSWGASTDGGAGLSHYEIERCEGASCTTWAQIDTVAAGTTTYSNTTGLSAFTLYRYRVRAVDLAPTPNLSEYSNIDEATTLDGTPPTDPSNLVATAISVSQINLSWDTSSDGESGISNYEVYRCEGASCTPTALIASPVEASYSDTTGLTEGTTYSYRVRAENGVGLFSGYSNTEVEATSSGSIIFPGSPTNISATASSTVSFSETSTFISEIANSSVIFSGSPTNISATASPTASFSEKPTNLGAQ